MKTKNATDSLGQLPKLSTEGEHSRRRFLQAIGVGAAALGLQQISCAGTKNVAQKTAGNEVIDLSTIPGFEKTTADPNASAGWQSISDRKIKVGLVGHGVCKFAVQFGFQDHPNVEVVAVSDLFPDRVAEMARIARCDRTYPSLEEMLKKDKDI